MSARESIEIDDDAGMRAVHPEARMYAHSLAGYRLKPFRKMYMENLSCNVKNKGRQEEEVQGGKKKKKRRGEIKGDRKPLSPTTPHPHTVTWHARKRQVRQAIMSDTHLL